MYLSLEKAIAVFKKVHLIRDHMNAYRLAPDRMRLSIEDLQWTISDMYGIKIEKHEVAFEGEYVRGMIERYNDRAVIYLRKQPEDYLRLTAVKELCHLAIDEPEDWSPYGTKTIEDLVYEVSLNGSEERLAEPRVQSEQFAEIAAIELLYPYRFRAGDIAELQAGKTTHKRIAVHFHVPEHVIGMALHPDHVALATTCWDKVLEVA